MNKILIIFCCICHMTFAQIGGKSSFSFLDRSFNAKSLAFGNTYISNQDQNPTVGVNSPALINEENSNHFSFNQLLQTGGIYTGMLNFTRKNTLLKANQCISLRYIDYGKMKETSEEGSILGDFSPADFILSSGFSKKLNQRLTFGLQYNFIFSCYYQKVIFGNSIDLAGIYKLKDTTQTIAFLLKNAGIQFNRFYNEEKNLLPIDLQFAYSHKLKHAPFRFNYLIHHLTKWDLSYFNPYTKATIDPLTGDSILPKSTNFIQKTALHFLPQIEMFLGKNIQIRFAFDYFRRYQMALTNRPGISGFSFGVGMNFKRFTLDYGFSSYSVSGSMHGISLISSFSNWKKRN